LRERPRGRVEVELDGAPWRVIPADAAVRAGLGVGRPLDRQTARALARELRRAGALGVAVRALRHRDMSRNRLAARLADRGAAPGAAEEALAALERAGLVDDRRVAFGRARALAERGYGDAAIRASLEADGLQGEALADALASLEPEPERARRLLERRGAGPKTLRWLSARGFEASSVEDLEAFADGP
jgi:regulatory protein